MSEGELFWGEIHTHSCLSDAKGTPQELCSIARDHLDFWAMADHAVWIDQNAPRGEKKWDLEEHWEEVQEVVAKNNQIGEFVTFLGYEWSSGEHGDYNVYYLNDHEPIRLGRTVAELYEKIRGTDAMLVPHHSAYRVGNRGIDWDEVQEDLTPVVEIYSMHGSSECDGGPFPMTWTCMGPRASQGTIQEALSKGLKLGFIASSDDHWGYAGCYKMGLVAAYAKELNRRSIWESLAKRHVYAVTGDRIKMSFDIDEHMMGEVLQRDRNKPRVIKANVEGCDAIDKVDVLRNNEVLASHKPRRWLSSGSSELRVKLRVEWGWGRPRHTVDWKGGLEVVRGQIESVAPCFGAPSPNRIISRDQATCHWISTTNGIGSRYEREPTNSIVFGITGDAETRVKIDLDSKSFCSTLNETLRKSTVEFLGGMWDDKIKIHRAVPLEDCSLDIVHTDKSVAKKVDFYYLRVNQINGQMAWSSPIWIQT